LLPDGKVLVAGGDNFGTIYRLPSAELYDPARGMWTTTGTLATARSLHTATLLLNGQVLVAAGESALVPLVSAELYTPRQSPCQFPAPAVAATKC